MSAALGVSLLDRYQLDGAAEDAADLHEAVDRLSEALAGGSPDHPDRTDWTALLGVAHGLRFDLTMDPADRDLGIQALTEGLGGLPVDDPELGMFRMILGNLCWERGRTGAGPGPGVDLQTAVDNLGAVLHLPDLEPAARLDVRTVLGLAHALRHQRTGDREDLDAAIGHLADVLGPEPAGTGPPGLALELGRLLWVRGTLSASREDTGAAIRRFRHAVDRMPSDLDPVERDFFLFCEKLSRTTQPVRVEHERTTPLYNPVIWLVAREGDLPVWLTAGNDMIRSIGVPPPDFGARQGTARLLARVFGVHDPAADARAAELCEAFAEQSEGLTLQAMIEVTRLARDRGLGFEALPDAVRTYKLGVLDSPWRREYLRERIVAGETSVARRVIGQQQAVTKTLDILKRAALGLSGAQASRASSRPRGVLFFAGPTGVGKTELAKSISAMVFGDESAYLRFDMSEFAAEHAGDRLIGAPPGYVGFEAGGELTNAVRQQPFRVILFDEIEKAHPRILDKFLQILDDGRLTDGRGVTAYFSESILVFTSNLGMVVDDASGRSRENARPGLAYEELESRIRGAVSDHFTRVLNRPELLNRFGDNIVVFDFIGRDAAAHIFALLLGNIVNRVAEEHRVALTVDRQVADTLRDWCIADLGKGGRGIGNALESYFVNPLARALFARAVTAGETVRVRRLDRRADIVTLELA